MIYSVGVRLQPPAIMICYFLDFKIILSLPLVLFDIDHLVICLLFSGKFQTHEKMCRLLY